MIINIGRELAAGGREVGKRLAATLGYRYFDKEIILEASKRSGISTQEFERQDETYNKFLVGLGLGHDNLYHIQDQVIHDLAEAGNAVFVGRTADHILRDRSDCLNIFLSATTSDRCQRLMSKEQLTEAQALELIHKTDAKRADYYEFFTGKRWGDARSYDLCINTSNLGIDLTIQLILQYVKLKR